MLQPDPALLWGGAITLAVFYLGSGLLGWWTARKANRLDVSGDEREARRDVLAERAEALAERAQADADRAEAERVARVALQHIYDLRAQVDGLGGVPLDWPEELLHR